jgi:hypothetical protein
VNVKIHIIHTVFLNYAINYRKASGSPTNTGPKIRGLHGTGPASRDDVRVWAEFGLGSNDINQILYRTFQAFPLKEKVIHSCTHFMLVIQSGSRNKSQRLDFLGDLRS